MVFEFFVTYVVEQIVIVLLRIILVFNKCAASTAWARGLIITGARRDLRLAASGSPRPKLRSMAGACVPTEMLLQQYLTDRSIERQGGADRLS
jgi:hypothetical protein